MKKTLTVLATILTIQALGLTSAFAKDASSLIGKGVVCGRVLGVLGNGWGVATEVDSNGKLILKTADYNTATGTYYVQVSEADPASCKVIKETL